MRHANSKGGYYLTLAANSNKMVIIFLLPLTGNYDLFDSALTKTSTVDRSIRADLGFFFFGGGGTPPRNCHDNYHFNGI